MSKKILLVSIAVLVVAVGGFFIYEKIAVATGPGSYDEK